MVDSVQGLGVPPYERWGPQRQKRRDNKETVLDSLREDGPGGRTKLVKRTGLSKGTVIACLADLIGEGLVRPESGGRGGPHPRYVPLSEDELEERAAREVREVLRMPGRLEASWPRDPWPLLRVPDFSDLLAMYDAAREAIPSVKGESWGEHKFRIRVLRPRAHMVKEDDGTWRVLRVETAL